jgi:AGZA family xanthine/uracil permease-like MFS transporter
MPTDSVFTTTALAAIIGTLIMAVYAKKPFALAPGMGLNAFFVFTVCLSMGYSWQFALTGILLEDILFIILTITNVRQAIVDTIPASLKYAIGAGIGLFIAFIGLQNAGIIIDHPATLVALSEAKSGPVLLFIIGMAITTIVGACLGSCTTTTYVESASGVAEGGRTLPMPKYSISHGRANNVNILLQHRLTMKDRCQYCFSFTDWVTISPFVTKSSTSRS